MTDETKIDSEVKQAKSAENKAVFGPLGKYAVIAVIMVSIIVTTAIMLDKQLNTAEHQIASFENKVAELHEARTETDEPALSDTQNTTEITIVADTPNSEIELVITTDELAVTAETSKQPEIVIATTPPVTTETATDITEQTAETKTVEIEAVEASIDAHSKTAQAQNTTAYTARIESFKAEQKQRISEMFARIKSLEAQQLDRYKLQQENQIAGLHKQIAQQQKMIEELVTRNENQLELRAANIQRNQANREEILNRI